MLFEFTGPIFKILFLRANASERLAERDGSYTVYQVATVHAEIPVFVCGFNMQVSLDLVVFQVDGRV